jgi:WD40 repeat protein
MTLTDGQQIISGSWDNTTCQWDLKAGKEIEGVQDVCKEKVWAVAVSQDGRWVVTGGGNWNCKAELKVCEVETGIVKAFEGHSYEIYCIDISADSTLLASGSQDEMTWICNLETSKLVAGPFKCISLVGVVQFSSDSKKVAVKLDWGTCPGSFPATASSVEGGLRGRGVRNHAQKFKPSITLFPSHSQQQLEHNTCKYCQPQWLEQWQMKSIGVE